MRGLLGSWQFWALGSALFAAMTAILAKVGVKDIPPDFATLMRTAVILLFGAALVAMTGQWRAPSSVPANTWLFIGLSGLATGASWLCYFRALKLGEAARVAPLDKLSVVLVAIIGATVLGERLSPRNWLGVAMIAGGAVLVALR